MIPQSMQAEMLLKIHANHFGPESNIRMAWEVLFWPGMRQAIFDMCNNCSTCAQYGLSSTKEPMRSLPIPTLPWQIINQDIFMHRQKAYLETVCHFSDWIEVDELDDTLATTMINKTKAHFAGSASPLYATQTTVRNLLARTTWTLPLSMGSPIPPQDPIILKAMAERRRQGKYRNPN